MMPITRRLFVAFAVILLLGTARAHHGWGGYDTGKAFTLTGPILRSAYENPHCEIFVQGEGKVWEFVLAPPQRMQSRGVKPEMVAAGKTCTVYGYPHTSKATEARIEYIVIDGKRYELR